MAAAPLHAEQRRPRIAFVELTRRCNLRCRMCRPDPSTQENVDIPPDILREVLEQVVPGVEFVDLRGWGESLLVRDLPRLIDHLHRRGVGIRLITNLSVNRPDALEALARAGAIIGVSLDSADPEKLSWLRAGARLKLIEENINRLRNAYARHAQPFECLYLNMAVGPDNLADIPGVVRFAIRCDVREVRLFPEMRGGDIAIREPSLCEQTMNSLSAAGELADAHGVLLTVGARLTTQMTPATPFRFHCEHPWTHTTIGADGAVGFCDFLLFPGNDVHQVGNLQHASFDQIWNGREFAAVRQAHTTHDWGVTPAVSACEWCFRNRYVDFERELDPKYRESVMRWRNFFPDVRASASAEPEASR